MVSLNQAGVHVFDTEKLAPIPFMGGLLIPISRNWPRTELPALPTAQRTCHDVTGDNIADVVLTTRVKLYDMDGNGVADAVGLRVIGGEAIQDDVAFDCGPQEREQAYERVISQL